MTLRDVRYAARLAVVLVAWFVMLKGIWTFPDSGMLGIAAVIVLGLVALAGILDTE